MTQPALRLPAALVAALLAVLGLLALWAPVAGARHTVACASKGHRRNAHACARSRRRDQRRPAADVRKAAGHGATATTHAGVPTKPPAATATHGVGPSEGCTDESCEGEDAGDGLTDSPCQEGGAATLEEGSFTCPGGDEPSCPPGTQTTLTPDETELVCEPAGPATGDDES